MNENARVAFDRRIDIEWLDYVASLSSGGLSSKEVKQMLISFLGTKLSGPDRPDSACGKAVRLLLRIWVNVDTQVIGLRDRALKILPESTADERLALHWALCLGGFHFFGDVASNAGRLLNLQGTISTHQMMRRIYEKWGERSTLSFAVQRALGSMVQWGALGDTAERGIYTQREGRVAVQGELAMLLLEGLLINLGKAIPIDQAIRHPSIFPFEVDLRIHDLRESSRFDIHRQGLDIDVVELATSEKR